MTEANALAPARGCRYKACGKVFESDEGRFSTLGDPILPSRNPHPRLAKNTIALHLRPRLPMAGAERV